MNQAESEYWDQVSVTVKGSTLFDNIWKRCAIVSRILSHRPIGARILEIGVGQGLAAALTNLAVLGDMRYVGTDVSKEFCEFVEKKWKLKTAHTDVRKLPDGPFDMVWAFDTLEHVRPEERPEGYLEINRVLAEHGLILLNIPLDESQHQSEFDWGMHPKEVFDIADACGCAVQKWEPYTVEEISRSYLWVELVR